MSLLTVMTSTRGTITGATAPALHFSSTPRALVALFYAHCDLEALSIGFPRSQRFTLLTRLAMDNYGKNSQILQLMATLLRLGAGIPKQIPEYSPLFAAIDTGHPDRAALLHAMGAEVEWNAPPSSRNNIHVVAVETRNPSSTTKLALMLDYGAPVDLVDDQEGLTRYFGGLLSIAI